MLNGNMFLFVFCLTIIYLQLYLYINVHGQKPSSLILFPATEI